MARRAGVNQGWRDQQEAYKRAMAATADFRGKCRVEHGYPGRCAKCLSEAGGPCLFGAAPPDEGFG